MRVATYVLVALSAAGSALAHMEMSSPPPFRSRHNPHRDQVDYDLKSPLSASGSNFPCKNHHHDTFTPVATYQAGQTARVTLEGSATHGGGSCQMSLSYDGGQTFRVIKSMIGGCPITKEYDFTIPTSAPSGDAIIAWTWFNLVGNREMYMNCAAVSIEGGANDSSEFNRLPTIFEANIGNGCSTSEGKHAVFAEPGDDVVWDGVSPNSPPFPNC